mmetsp:Transcript_17291/g.16949  ORF Transcript_17291/g.16949 Transcript_17291/m.16949 type:complete len:735 (-) Transcript_17291:35-2239(-)
MPDGPTVYNLDDYGILNLDNIPFKDDATEVSLFGNKLHDPYTITENLGKLEDLKALWLNDNPIEDNCHNFDEIGEFFKKLEIINSKFTSKAGEWAILFCCKDQKVNTLEDIEYLDLSSREFLKMKDITILERLTSLKTVDISDHKYLLSSLTEEILGTAELEHEGQKFEVTSHSHNINQFLSKMPQIENVICDDEVAEHFIKENNEGRLSEVLPNLKTINGFSIPSSFKDYKIEMEIKYIMKHLWKYTNSYKFSLSGPTQNTENYWYVQDEVGSHILHSDDYNVEVHPFIYCKDIMELQSTSNQAAFDPSNRITYSILWPKKNIEKDSILYRDFLPKIDETMFRSSRLSVWYDVPQKYFEEQLEFHNSVVEKAKTKVEAFDQAFAENQEKDDSFLNDLKELDRPVKLYSEYYDAMTGKDTYKKYLEQDEKFELVSSIEDADVVLSAVNFKKTALEINLDTEKHIFNQFPYESVLVEKSLLCDCLEKVYGKCRYYQESYPSTTRLPAFIGRFLEREKMKQENTWICKPVGLTKSRGHVISSNLECIIRQTETEPRVIQKYITNPYLIEGKKFDLRYWVVVRSFSPLNLYVYKYTYAKVAQEDFENTELGLMTWKKQFPVQDMDEGTYNEVILKDKIVESFNAAEEDGFMKFEEKVYEVIKELFRAAVIYKPEIHHENSRALYGIDILPDTNLQPNLLEATFMPEISRICGINDKYLSEISRCMFLGEEENMRKLF